MAALSQNLHRQLGKRFLLERKVMVGMRLGGINV